MRFLLIQLTQFQKRFIDLLRISIFLVMLWIGGLKVFPYEADGIVPFVANSPLMGFFYNKPAPEYQQYKNPEGKEVAVNKAWHVANGTYVFSYALGAVIVTIGLLLFMGIFFPKIGVLGGLLTFGMSLVTLSFLISTPEVYVPNLGGDFPTEYFGFPYLSGAGRLVLKDVIMMVAGLICASDSAQRIINKS
ncbi:DUF417 family protein [Flavobacterium sp. NKUCC04_CG]|uniref:DUF417 family protein n=1 Tax=Flavobacterium sp. NKUCC04_CG TaxID=2842121 RepID=UPI00351D1154